MCQFPLFETILIIDGVAQNLAYHQARLNNTIAHLFQREEVYCLQEIIRVPREFQQGIVRCRIDYHQTAYQLQFSHYLPKVIRRFQCVYTQDFTYSFKYSDRKRLDLLNSQQADEIIIVNNGWISDGSIGNLLFLKAGQWYSPQDYLLKGTQLSYLIDNKQVKLTKIAVQDLLQYERVMLINALNRFELSRSLPISAIQF
ncbi:branched-chain amino acid aminotransferase [[Haemophilus] ducreyi]|uniref:4-amino-4-deoxychorismate lyase n=2 Tax=Haemophilus ducreyi TaxID=730 RepID=Q7VNS8_HAEDU|nr:aminotransferase class IV family protein [[Haemophilus] ducreyi]AAP95374.1 hypothetical protein HD_0409 [[Haemophilus] ducreyi 35000HP]AKO30495.1 branched-chain amino acid aminotransferase [[Haemophilus] ducreyi]AKO31930.1 branched-chain amino acid aminotransferase [[Haemophilus] ducreyi]AKO33384.1 branched-chain amino acid aminotransferase [[Haemophilus] ducreyi]AKO34832.1 branched-chain amino acid aminotransferase [[Haemophilus] ducreyi]